MFYKKIFTGFLFGILLVPTITFGYWQPGRFENITWHWQLNGDLHVTEDVDMYDIDLFDTPKSTIQELQYRGVKVMCYFSAGALEFKDTDHDTPLRADSPPFPTPYSSITGNEVEDYDKELWLDIRASEVHKIKPTIEGRFDLAVEKGCDGVEVDNVNEYEVDDDDPTELPVANTSGDDTGFDSPVTAADQLAYNKWLATEAHTRNLSIGFKNDIYQAAQLVNDFDWALNEQCYQYTDESNGYYECNYYNAFDEANKAVFGVEFNLDKGDFCAQSNAKGRYWAKKNLILDAYQENCAYVSLIMGTHTSIHAGLTPIYRLYNRASGVHLYTRGKNDGNKILAKWPVFEFTDGVPAFYASLTPQAGLAPIYRLYNKRTGVHLYTRGEADRDKVLNKWHDFDFTDGVAAFYASLTPQSGLTPIYRLYNKRTGVHLYTRGEADRDKVLNKWHDFDFTDGVAAFYAALN